MEAADYWLPQFPCIHSKTEVNHFSETRVWLPPTRLHGFIFQKAMISVFTAFETSWQVYCWLQRVNCFTAQELSACVDGFLSRWLVKHHHCLKNTLLLNRIGVKVNVGWRVLSLRELRHFRREAEKAIRISNFVWDRISLISEKLHPLCCIKFCDLCNPLTIRSELKNPSRLPTNRTLNYES